MKDKGSVLKTEDGMKAPLVSRNFRGKSKVLSLRWDRKEDGYCISSYLTYALQIVFSKGIYSKNIQVY